MPCLIQEQAEAKHTSSSYYWTRPLVPPGIYKGDKFFVADLIIPCVHLYDIVTTRSGGKSYIMLSEYLGSQRLFVDGNKIKDGSSLQGNIFHAVIRDAKDGKKCKNPLVTLFRDPLSKEILRQNRDEFSSMEMLQRKTNVNEMFWWDV